jgi:hypothetical protein
VSRLLLGAALLVTAVGAVGLVAADRRQHGHPRPLVLVTAVLGALAAVGAAVVAVAGPAALGTLALVVAAAPGLAVGCAAAATRGRPGDLVVPPDSAPEVAGSRLARRRAGRRLSRQSALYAGLLVVVVAVGVGVVLLTR